jgi:dipeptide/tripeptide permease
MTSQELNAAIANFRQQQIAQRKLWVRCGFGSYGIGLMLCLVVIVKVAITGDEAPSPMLFVVLGYMFLGLAFIHAGRSTAFRWSRSR